MLIGFFKRKRQNTRHYHTKKIRTAQFVLFKRYFGSGNLICAKARKNGAKFRKVLKKTFCSLSFSPLTQKKGLR